MNRKVILRDIKKNINGWVVTSLVGVAAVLLPSIYILLHLFRQPNDNWKHIQQYLLKDYVLQSLWLVLFTGIFTIIIGVSLAWLVSAYDFPLKRFFSWAFILPLAIPPYIAAYTYSNMLSYTGTVQTVLRNVFGVVPNQKYFSMMSIEGAVFIFTMFLFPYVYIITKTFLERQSSSFIENARLLGKKPLVIFFRVVLPMSRAAIAGGVSLVIFEVLNDFGVTSYFGVQTFSTAIFKTWFGMYDLDSAIRLASLLMCGIIGLYVVERLLRHRKKFSSSSSKIRPLVPKKLHGFSAVVALLCCLLVFALSFLIPVVQLIVWAGWTYKGVLNASFLDLAFRTVWVSLLATGIIMVFAAVVANVCRMRQTSVFTQVIARLISMGYSIPGAVVAIGVLSLFIWLDNKLGWLYQWFGMDPAKLVLSLSPSMLIIAYVIRFMAIGFNPVEAGFEKIGTKYFEASRLLGKGITKTFFQLDIRLIKGALLSGTILTFVEIVKELPLTLLLRPFNFETLATKTYQYASDERIHEASIPSLFIIAISMISVFIYYRLGEKKQR